MGLCDRAVRDETSGPMLRRRAQAQDHSVSPIQTLDEMLACLADGFPFVFGFTVYESFESPRVGKTGVMPVPKKTERTLGGHAVMAMGYSLKDKRLIVRNSWGKEWGQKGYFTMPFEYVETLAQDFWTIRK